MLPHLFVCSVHASTDGHNILMKIGMHINQDQKDPQRFNIPKIVEHGFIRKNTTMVKCEINLILGCHFAKIRKRHCSLIEKNKDTLKTHFFILSLAYLSINSALIDQVK